MRVSEFEAYRAQVKAALSSVDADAVRMLSAWLAEVRAQGGCVFVAGNGGSAATASHFATDLGKGASYGFTERFRAIALTDNVPLITAYANDVGYEVVFAEQLRSLGRPGDVLVVITGSGNSPNILAAVETARELGVRTVSLTGFAGGRAAGLSDCNVNVASDHMGVIEDVHMSICHAVAFDFMEQAAHSLH